MMSAVFLCGTQLQALAFRLQMTLPPTTLTVSVETSFKVQFSPLSHQVLAGNTAILSVFSTKMDQAAQSRQLNTALSPLSPLRTILFFVWAAVSVQWALNLKWTLHLQPVDLASGCFWKMGQWTTCKNTKKLLWCTVHPVIVNFGPVLLIGFWVNTACINDRKTIMTIDNKEIRNNRTGHLRWQLFLIVAAYLMY